METALKQIHDWAAELEVLCERLAPRFGRVEVRRRASGFLHGLLSGAERKNGWQLAEQAGNTTPDGMQRLLNHACWDAEAVRDDLRDYVVEHLGDPGGVLVVDETGFLKKGTKSAGVQRQYSGTAGRIENCQIGVFLAYASRHGHALIDRELYLPESWTDDRPRCREAGVPDSVEFHTKPQLARRMLARALDAGVPTAWVTADEVYGGDGRLRRWLEERDVAHVLAVNRNQSLVSGLFRFERADQLAARIPAGAWRHLSAGQGAKGERIYAWARVAIRPLREPGRGHWLLVRRSLASGELAYYVCYGPADTSLAELVQVAGVRWTVECGFQQGKGETGLDHYQVRRYQAWYRHVTLSMLAQAFWPSSAPGPRSARGAAERAELVESLVALSVPEIRRLLWLLVWPPPAEPARVLDWSWWRRRHQARARRSHWKRRQQRPKVRLEVCHERGGELDVGRAS